MRIRNNKALGMYLVNNLPSLNSSCFDYTNNSLIIIIIIVVVLISACVIIRIKTINSACTDLETHYGSCTFNWALLGLCYVLSFYFLFLIKYTINVTPPPNTHTHFNIWALWLFEFRINRSLYVLRKWKEEKQKHDKVKNI